MNLLVFIHAYVLFSSFILTFFYFCLSGLGCVPEDEAYIPTYLEAFPPLPEKGAPGEKAGEPASAWGSKIRPIKASVITQVKEPLTIYIYINRHTDIYKYTCTDVTSECIDTY